MAFKQPRIPAYRSGEGIEAYIGKLTLFLRDFCQEAWMTDRMRKKEIEEIRRQVESILDQIEQVGSE